MVAPGRRALQTLKPYDGAPQLYPVLSLANGAWLSCDSHGAMMPGAVFPFMNPTSTLLEYAGIRNPAQLASALAKYSKPAKPVNTDNLVAAKRNEAARVCTARRRAELAGEDVSKYPPRVRKPWKRKP